MRREMKPSSQDLRDRIMAALTAGHASQPVIAARCCVSLALVETLWQRLRHNGSSAAKAHAGGRRRTITTLTDVRRLTLKTWRCIPPACPQFQQPYRPEAEGRLALPKHE